MINELKESGVSLHLDQIHIDIAFARKVATQIGLACR